ncbi:MAG: DUF4198 domain-containing protein [Vicinamibacteraceae bacterium]
MTRPRLVAALGAAWVAAATLASAHELFLHPRGFFVAPRATITLPVFNGAFGDSENAIERSRITDLSLRGPEGRTPIDRATWTERDPRSTVRVTVAGPGTYVVGVEIGARTIALDGPVFDRYLAEEGITPILNRRRAAGRIGTRARESYAKAAKALIAVTDAAGHLAAPARDGASAALVASGYAAEIVPLVDPYTVTLGAIVPVRALVDGRPLAGWTIHAGGTVGTSTTAIPTQILTTDADGQAEVRLTHDGHWFIAFVHMVDAAPGAPVDYVSRWATLTFGVLPQ